MSEVTVRQFVDELLDYLGKCQRSEALFADEFASMIHCALEDAEHKASERRRLLTKHSERGNIT